MYQAEMSFPQIQETRFVVVFVWKQNVSEFQNYVIVRVFGVHIFVVWFVAHGGLTRNVSTQWQRVKEKKGTALDSVCVPNLFQLQNVLLEQRYPSGKRTTKKTSKITM